MAEVLLHGGASLELNSACNKGSELCIRDVSKGVSPSPALLRESTSDERSRNADRAPETAGEDRSAGAGSAGRSDPARLAVIQHAGEPTSAGASIPRPHAAPAKPRHRCVMVAKCLTNSDSSSGRVILPRLAVETNLPFVIPHRHYALHVGDAAGRRHQFCIKSWANGTEHRRVYVLEQAADFLRACGAGVGDAVGICSDERGELLVEVNTPEVRQAAVCPRYSAPAGGAAAAAAMAATSLPSASGRCARSVHCGKAAGHAGFCSGAKAAAAALASAELRRKLDATSDNSQASLVAAAAEGGTAGGADECSSDGTAATTVALHPAALPAARLPPHPHPLAHLAPGLRISKRLTAYDIASRRIILPADDVSAGVPNAAHSDLLSVAAVDESRVWQALTMRAWYSVVGRRGYALEDGAGFLSERGAVPGDELVVFRRGGHHEPPRIQVWADGNRLSVRRPRGPPTGQVFTQLPPALRLPQRPSVSSSLEGTPHAFSAAAGPAGASGPGGVCRRTACCTKAPGHQGFCSGHRGFKRKDGGGAHAARGAAARQHGLLGGRRAGGGESRPTGSWQWGSDDDDEEYEPAAAKHPRRAPATPRGGSQPGPSTSHDPLLSLLSLLHS